MEKYEIVKDIGSGNFGVTKLVKEKFTKELFAVKFIARGQNIDDHVMREIVNHSSLNHPNIVKFKEVLLTPSHLAIVMEYAAGGELFGRICNAGRFGEDEARYFFQQLISGVSYCHSMRSQARKHSSRRKYRAAVENLRFRSSNLHSQPKSTVGTPAYVAPEVLSKSQYDGNMADVWSCGVTLYVMLVGTYPFEDPFDPKNFRKMIEVRFQRVPVSAFPEWILQRILCVEYAFPDLIHVSAECKHLISRIFVANPEKRIKISEVRRHPWFMTNLPVEMAEGGSWQRCGVNTPSQSVEEIVAIVREARTTALGDFLMASGDFDFESEMDDFETSDDFVCSI